MNDMKVYPIGKIENENNEVKIILDSIYKKGLNGLSGYSHVQVLWWMDATILMTAALLLKRSCTYQVLVESSILPHRNGVATGQSPMKRAAILIGLRNLIFKEG